jgi:hypothetical protein
VVEHAKGNFHENGATPSPYLTEFQDYSQLFARILADRGLGRWFDESLLQRRT